jgi:hypothetical protein
MFVASPGGVRWWGEPSGEPLGSKKLSGSAEASLHWPELKLSLTFNRARPSAARRPFEILPGSLPRPISWTGNFQSMEAGDF